VRAIIGQVDMAFEDKSTTAAQPRYAGEGFRQEADFRDGEQTASGSRRPPNLSYVFDDPAEGEPGRDRFGVHVVWELVLALAVVGVGFLLYRQNSNLFHGDALRGLLLQVAELGLVGAAAAIALRAGAANLAVGPVAVAAGYFFAGHSHNGALVTPLLIIVGLAAAIGAVQGLGLVLLHVPGWAASLAAAAAVLAWIVHEGAPTPGDGYAALPDAYWWVGAFAVVSIAFGAVGVSPTLRRRFGRFRPVSDPADRRGLAAALTVLVVTIASSILAALGGVLAAASPAGSAPLDGFTFTAVAIGIALVGGTSAFGRRGGVLGTVLAAALFTLVASYARAKGWTWSPVSLAAVALAVGVAVTRLIEQFGRPAAPKPDEDEPVSSDWLRSATAPTTGTTPTSASPGGLWASDDAWGTTR
jgi:ribose/xylose/arabinose/galactoside ABC-type transport system permease subunit